MLPLPSFIIFLSPHPHHLFHPTTIIHKSKIENERSNVEQAYFGELLTDWEGGASDVISKQAVMTIQAEK